MKKNKLFLCFLSCLLITSCSNGGNLSEADNIFSGRENIELYTNDEYALYVQKYSSKKLVYYYEELFGIISENKTIVQYNYEYIYKYNNVIEDNLISTLYQNVLANLSKIKEEYQIKDLSIKENGYIETCLFEVDNQNKYDLSVVIVDLYIPFVLVELNTHKTTYLALPMYKYELLKHDNLIQGFDGKEIEFNEFITTYDILKK